MASIVDMLRRPQPDTQAAPVALTPAQLKAMAEIPPSVADRLARGRKWMLRDAAKRRLCVRFERGDSYWFITKRGQLNQQSTITDPMSRDGKPPHRVRNKYNLIRPMVTAKVSASTQGSLAPEVVPTTTDPTRVGAARLAEKVALAGMDRWRLSAMDVDCSLKAIGHGGEGFAFPYFDPNVGPYRPKIDPATGEPAVDALGNPVMIGEGEIKVAVFGGNEVFWEEGVDFVESRWWGIERARVIDDLEELPGFFGAPLKADAATSELPTDRRPGNMVICTEYLERPCPRYPNGRHIVIANGRQIVPAGTYPLKDRAGKVIDEPCIHRLAWDLGGGAERDFGLTWQLIDAQRTFQDARNKAVEWKNRCIVPQWRARMNSITKAPTDEPGILIQYKGDQAPEPVPVAPIPDSLFQIADSAKEDMREIGFDSSISAGPNVAARTVQAVIEQSNLQWAQFLIHKADWWSRVLRHCLLLVSAHYSEPRLLTFRGRDGWEHVPDFEGIQLMGQVDVRVYPHNLVSTTRDGVKDQVTWLVQMFPGQLSMQDALAALQSASLDRLTQSYWLDVARANNAVQKIRDGSALNMPTTGTTNPLTGQPTIGPDGQPMQIPMWMPNQQDNLAVWERVFGDWMKTDDYAAQPAPAQEAARVVWDAIQQLKTLKAQQAAAQQTMLAQQLGMSNAAKPPQGATPMPSLPGVGGQPPPAAQ